MEDIWGAGDGYLARALLPADVALGAPLELLGSRPRSGPGSRYHHMARGAGAHRRGLDTEALAEAYLSLSGWRVLARRWKTRGGEADLIVLRGGVLAVVEVKARGTLDEALLAVRPRGWARVAEAGAHFLAHADLPPDLAVRLDLVAIAPPLEIAHVPGAGEEVS